MNSPLICAGLGLLALGTAHAELVDIRWNDAGRFEYQAQIAPAKFAEVCGKLGKGQRVDWSFRAERPTQFNIHYHESKQVVYPAKVDGASAAEGQLNPALDQDFCWMWSNKTDKPIALTLTLQR
ncbi:hypothetical protein [Roseateles toxinivorans]|uniref:Beta/gamma crystallin n=1 Tax=Roseateles toxinivorans TaxID=270368 RepID=A0A4R6QMM1_9BURK|nr:hypothetical protein [Roseateles toxinivorans]TDP64095.1 hypothetical protein DES47_104383 [Roseateles toxinivorans]